MDDFFEIISNGMVETTLDAKANHRFTARSGNLERSIIPEVIRTNDNIIGMVFLKDEIALYGKYIHNGFRSWRPDPFLKNSAETHFEIIKQKLKQKFDEILRK